MLVCRLFSEFRKCVRNQSHKLHSSVVFLKAEDRKGMMASLPDKDEGTSGEKSIDIDGLIQRRDNFFSDAQTQQQLFNDVPFANLPICHIRISPNNTIISFTDSMGVPRLIRSCGIEGFKNTRKGTNIAAQATAITISEKAIELGWKVVRVTVRGLGPGRMKWGKISQVCHISDASVPL
ncbi:uncharacterized protein mRpS11 isoform X2 [Eurosta solidaginis]|uniref:uncharacterized protein mRpS11 isoform X2 n=1 Tax=Eurosta solidaginis TaxID=178769 RepID=UPI003531134B